jgi:ATP-binding cassette subfamily B protein
MGYQMMLIWPLIALGWIINVFQRADVSWERIEKVLQTEPSIAEPGAPTATQVTDGAIELRGVTVAYVTHGIGEGRSETDLARSAIATTGTAGNRADPALREISLRIPAGQTLGITGVIGSGKSTLTHLVPHLLEIEPGRVFVDGIDIREWSLDGLRAAIGIVPQDPFLFSDTIAANVAFGRPSATEDEIRDALRRAAMLDEIDAMPTGINTRIGERGLTLSGGQKQRVAIARALLMQPKILLLDDCLSAVDHKTEEAILRELRALMGGANKRTTIMVSHRVSGLQLCDRVVVMRDGSIIESGTPGELAAQPGGWYAALAARQRLVSEIESWAPGAELQQRENR